MWFPLCSFYDREAPIYTMSRFLPPSKVLDAEVSQSIIGDGCLIRANAKITHSVIGLRALIGESCAPLLPPPPLPSPSSRNIRSVLCDHAWFCMMKS